MTSQFGKWVGLTNAAALGALIGATPASAQSRNDEAVFVDLGRWTIVERTQSRYCELRYNSNDVDGLVFIKSDGRPGSLRLNGRSSRRHAQGPISWQFDNNEFDGQLLRGGSYALATDSSVIEQQFRKAKTLTIRQGGQAIAQLSLKTSSAGFRLLNQCAEQWRYKPAPTQLASAPTPTTASRTVAPSPRPRRSLPPPPQARTQPAVATAPARPTGPFPPNRGLTALNPGDWVRANDFRRFSQSRFGSGSVRFTLLVNEKGRVEECVVNASSGSRDFDSKACRSLQKRARFEPATDANGNVTSANYTSSVRFAVAE